MSEKENDVRIRRECTGGGLTYRVVAPSAKQRGSSEYMNGKLVIERIDTDALGEKYWKKVGEVTKETQDQQAVAIYYLLAGDVSD